MNGIGPEIILKTFSDQRMLDFCIPIIYCSGQDFDFFKRHYKIDVTHKVIKDIQKPSSSMINVFPAWNTLTDIDFGICQKNIGKLAVKSLKTALGHIKKKSIDVLVTAPINKEAIQSEDFNFKGHTDYLDSEIEGRSLMFMITNKLKIGLLTEHIPINNVSESINKDLVTLKINDIHDTLINDFGIQKPKIAILGLNPHSGDNGVIGKEDDLVLKPAIQLAQEQKKLVYGPYAADSFFVSNNYKSFDAIIAAYHDQGLIPFKTLSFGRGVNYTAGLKIVRTSPDHGTAYEIAGKGCADESSFKEAIFFAIEIYNKRSEYFGLKKNSLKAYKFHKNKKTKNYRT